MSSARDGAGHLAGQAGRTADQPLVVFLDLGAVGTRAHVETLGPRLRDNLDQVVVSLEVLGQQDQVVAALVGLALLVLQAAARHKLFVQFHGSSKPSGLVRTYPNEFTREGTMNYEVCKWSDAVTADHDVSIPFTRMLAGSTDYHLGGFRSELRSEFRPAISIPGFR